MMQIPLRADAEYGLTPAQFAAMPERLRRKVAGMDPGEDGAAEAARLNADIAVWEQAASQLSGKDGKWSIVWSKVKAGSSSEEASPPKAAMKEAEGGVDGPDDDEDEDEDDEDEAPTADVAEAAAALATVIAEVGRRNSAADLASIQAAHDTLVTLGATCAAPMTEALIEVDPMAMAAEMAIHESGWGDIEVTFAEADAVFDREKREVWITPIRPGPGNSRDGMYYPAKTLREAVEAGKFDNVLMFANHPKRSDERELPERSVRDWVGVIKETVWDDSRQRPRSRLKVLDSDVYDRFEAAPEHIAFSVLGGGRARAGRVNGESKRIVESMDKVSSVDWVTRAGAGGGIDFAESATEEFEMELSQLTLEQVREGNPALYAAIREDKPDDKAEGKSDDKDEKGGEPDESAARKSAQTQGPAAQSQPAKDPLEAKQEAERQPEGGAGQAVTTGAPAPEGYVSREEYEALKSQVERAQSREAQQEAQDIAQEVLTEALRTSTLPRNAREYVMDRFREVGVGEGFTFDTEAEMREAVEGEIAALAKITQTRTTRVRGLGTSADDDDARPTSLREAKEASIYERMGNEAMPDSRRNDGEEGRPASGDTAKAGAWSSQV